MQYLYLATQMTKGIVKITNIFHCNTSLETGVLHNWSCYKGWEICHWPRWFINTGVHM